MPETTARGLRYPLGDESPDWPGDFGRLADGIDDILPRAACGRVRVGSVANTPTYNHVDFPEGRFDSTPFIIASPISTVPGGTVELASYGSPSSSGVDIYVRRTSSTATNVAWAAFELGGGASLAGWQKPQYDGASNTAARPTRYLDSLQAAVRAGLIRIEAGQETLSGSNYRTKEISFPEGKFSSVPTVVVSVDTPSPGVASTYAGAVSAGADGFTLYGYRSNTNSMEVSWIAIQVGNSKRLWTPGGPADLAGVFREFAENVESTAPRIDAGTVTQDSGSGTQRAEFQSGLFTEPPIVAVFAQTGSSTVLGVSSYNVTATGADININRTSGTGTNISWIAVQP